MKNFNIQTHQVWKESDRHTSCFLQEERVFKGIQHSTLGGTVKNTIFLLQTGTQLYLLLCTLQKWLHIECCILSGNSRARLRLFLRTPAWFYDKNTAPKAHSLSNVLYLNATSLLQPNPLKGFLVKPLLVFILCTGPDRSNFTLISNLTTRVLMTLVRV